jgi:IS30 family transposase
MAENVRTNEQRECDLVTIADLYVKGYSQAAIAKEIGVSRSQIQYDLAEIRRRWVESTIRDFDAAKEAELKKLDSLEEEAWEAWRRSIGETKTTHAEIIDNDEKGRTSKQKVIKREMNGDPRFMSIVQSCIQQRCKILGIEAANKHEHSGPGGGPIQTEGTVNYEGLTVDELRAIDTILSKVASDDRGGT